MCKQKYFKKRKEGTKQVEVTIKANEDNSNNVLTIIFRFYCLNRFREMS